MGGGARTDVGSNGGEPNGGHASADAAPEAAEGRAPADVEQNTNVGSDGCETYGWDEGGGGGSDGEHEDRDALAVPPAPAPPGAGIMSMIWDALAVQPAPAPPGACIMSMIMWMPYP